MTSKRDVSFGSSRMHVLVGADEGYGLTVLEEQVPPGMEPPAHAHLRASETFYVLEGSYRFVVDGTERNVSAGEIISVPPGATHSWTAGPDGARSLIIFVPGGMEGYFAELGTALRAAGERPLDDDFLATMRERYGMDIRW